MSFWIRPAKKGPALDFAIRHESIGRHLNHQRRSGSARHFIAKRRTRGCIENFAAAAMPKHSAAIGTSLSQAVHDALYASKIVSYAQGMELLGAASTAYNWNLNFGDIATIWRGGCIIRAKFLNRITEAYARDPKLHNLLLDHTSPRSSKKHSTIGAWRSQPP